MRKIFKKRKRRKPNNIQTKATQSEQEPDEVYIITSKIYNINGKQLYKIGRSKDYWGSRKKNYDSDTALPVPIETLMVFHSDTHRYLENHLLNKYNHLKCNEHPHRREFFYLSSEDLFKIYIQTPQYKGYHLSYINENLRLKFEESSPKQIHDPMRELPNLTVEKGYFKSTDEFHEWFEEFATHMKEIEEENSLHEYYVMQERKEGYFCPEEYAEGKYGDDAIYYISDYMCCDPDLIKLILFALPQMEHMIEEHTGAYD